MQKKTKGERLNWPIKSLSERIEEEDVKELPKLSTEILDKYLKNAEEGRFNI